MKFYLKRIIEKDKLKNSIEENLKFYTDPNYNELLIDGNKVNLDELCVNIDNANETIFEENCLTDFLGKEVWRQNFEIGIFLKNKFKKYENNLGDLRDSTFWIYFNHLPFVKKYIIERYFQIKNDNNDNNKSLIEKIKRYFFCENQITRQGLRFNWELTNLLYYNDIADKSRELCEVAFHFIDSVKAIYERSFKQNPFIVKAFVQGIIRNNRSSAFTDKSYRTLIPTHISNIAALNCFDSYSYHDLIEKITYEQRLMINEYESSRD